MTPTSHPDQQDATLAESLRDKAAALAEALRRIAAEWRPAVFASSLGAEDMVITDVIVREHLPIEIFSLDTGRLPAETYDLMHEIQRRYGLKLKLYYPRNDVIEAYTRENGINAFYDSIELRKACCNIRKVEPLQRALANRKAWITGMRAQQAATRDGLPLQQYDETNKLEKFNPLSDWTEQEVWAYIRGNDVPYNKLHDRFYPSIGCAPCTRAISLGEDVRAGRWWWEDPTSKECGLHLNNPNVVSIIR
jgi:phosphoadenosine phosphosulfate reductase